VIRVRSRRMPILRADAVKISTLSSQYGSDGHVGGIRIGTNSVQQQQCSPTSQCPVAHLNWIIARRNAPTWDPRDVQLHQEVLLLGSLLTGLQHKVCRPSDGCILHRLCQTQQCQQRHRHWQQQHSGACSKVGFQTVVLQFGNGVLTNSVLTNSGLTNSVLTNSVLTNSAN
jgi:hypothetical protein